MVEQYYRKTTTNRKHQKYQHMRHNEDWILNVHAIKDPIKVERLMYELRHSSKRRSYNLCNEIIALMGIVTEL